MLGPAGPQSAHARRVGSARPIVHLFDWDFGLNAFNTISFHGGAIAGLRVLLRSYSGCSAGSLFGLPRLCGQAGYHSMPGGGAPAADGTGSFSDFVSGVFAIEPVLRLPGAATSTRVRICHTKIANLLASRARGISSEDGSLRLRQAHYNLRRNARQKGDREAERARAAFPHRSPRLSLRQGHQQPQLQLQLCSHLFSQLARMHVRGAGRGSSTSALWPQGATMHGAPASHF